MEVEEPLLPPVCEECGEECASSKECAENQGLIDWDDDGYDTEDY